MKYKLFNTAVAVLSLGAIVPVFASPRNIVVNGSFESSVDERPEGWQLFTAPSGKGKPTLVLDSTDDHGKALRLQYPAQPTGAASHDPLLAPTIAFGQRGIALNVSDPYTLSFWIRGKDISGQSVSVSLVDFSGHEYTALKKEFYATTEWKHYEFNFQWWLNKAPSTAELRFSLSEYGTIWLSDVSIATVSPSPPAYNPQVIPTRGGNLLPNGSFEVGTDGWATLGVPAGWGGGLTGLYGEISKDSPFDGKNCLKIDLGPGRSPETFADGWPQQRVVQNALLAANRGWLRVTPGESYTLSAYMRASRPGVVGRLLIRQAGDPLKEGIQPTSRDADLSEKWERYSLTVKATSSQMCVAVGPDIAKTPEMPATAWLDGLQFVKGSQPTALLPSEPLEVGVELDHPGHVFTPQDHISLNVFAANTSPTPTHLLLRAIISNYFGQVVSRPQFPLDVPAGSTLEKPFALDELGHGFFKVRVDWGAGSSLHEREFRLSILDPYPWNDSLFGVNHAPADPRLAVLLQQAGVLWARDWSLDWGQLEPEQGHLSFAGSDVQLDRLKHEGFKILCLLPPLPSSNWASSAPDSVTPELWNRMSYLPKDPKQLLHFVSQAVEHSRDRVRVWEFLNEPVWTGFCLPSVDFNKPGAAYTPADYVNLLKQVYPVIKAADPEGRVIGGFAAQPWHYAREFMELGGLQSVDIFNIHNYGTTRPPEAFIGEMETLQKIMDENGGRKPIWLTEYSYYGVDQFPWEPWSPPSDAWAANLLLSDEQQCADWTVRYDVIFLAHGVEKIFYHSGINSEPNNGVASLECAFLSDDGQTRKVFSAQGVLARVLGPECHFSRPLATGGVDTQGVYGYAFQCGSRSVMPVWADEAAAKSGQWRISLPDGVEARDIMGNTLKGKDVTLSVSPIYLISNHLPADQLAQSCTVIAP